MNRRATLSSPASCEKCRDSLYVAERGSDGWMVSVPCPICRPAAYAKKKGLSPSPSPRKPKPKRSRKPSIRTPRIEPDPGYKICNVCDGAGKTDFYGAPFKEIRCCPACVGEGQTRFVDKTWYAPVQPPSTTSKVTRRGETKPHWTFLEEKILKDNFHRLTLDALEKMLPGRSPKSILTKAHRLNLNLKELGLNSTPSRDVATSRESTM